MRCNISEFLGSMQVSWRRNGNEDAAAAAAQRMSKRAMCKLLFSANKAVTELFRWGKKKKML